MSFWKNALLIAGGAAAGYLASRSQKQTGSTSAELTVRSEQVIQKFVGEDGSVARFLDSKYGAPFKSSALGVLRFAANVKAGMDEKEAELKQRFEDQKQDLRPGSIDTWGESKPQPPQADPSKGAEVIDSTLADGAELREERARKRLARDAELGKDFFS